MTATLLYYSLFGVTVGIEPYLIEPQSIVLPLHYSHHLAEADGLEPPRLLHPHDFQDHVPLLWALPFDVPRGIEPLFLGSNPRVINHYTTEQYVVVTGFEPVISTL